MSRLKKRANLEGRRTVVVGGGGVGRAVTLALAEEGVDIAVCDKNETALAETADMVRALGRKVLAKVADVRSPAQLKAFYDEVAARFEAVEIVVNVAGGVQRRSFWDISPQQREEDIRLNFGYVLDSTQFALPLIRKAGKGGNQFHNDRS